MALVVPDGARLIMIATIVVAAGVNIQLHPIDGLESLILVTIIGLDIGVMMMPETLAQFPPLTSNILSCRLLCKNYKLTYVRYVRR